MNIKIIIGIIAAIIVVGGILFLKNKAPSFVGTSVFTQDEDELEALAGDLNVFFEEESAAREINETLDEAAGIAGGISVSEAFSSASISQEAGEVDFSKDLADFNSDETSLQELGQVFEEILP